MTAKLYRAEPGYDMAPRIRELDVVRETPKSWWVNDDGLERRIGKDWTKRFAAPTKSAAIEDYRARLRKKFEILERRLNICLHEMRLAGVRTPPLYLWEDAPDMLVCRDPGILVL